MKPSEIFDAKPDTLARMKVDHRVARLMPNAAVNRGLYRMAESSRCSTNQFSNQPAIRLDVNKITPVKAAHISVGPSSVRDPSTCIASLALIMV